MIRCRIEAFSRERERERWRAFGHSYQDIISIENLLASWQEFLSGKKKRRDVAEFSVNFLDNILALHQELTEKTYRHGPYHAFKINDPKPRDIHKASVRDRLVHHAIYRILYPYFDKKFIFDSYSCRFGKGTHRALNRFRDFAGKVSRNHTSTCWVLKCDIKKFFANIDHQTLMKVLFRGIADKDILWLLENVISSFSTAYHSSCDSRIYDIGLPLGNLTSQLLVNIYMNEFDQWMKHTIKTKYYIRYADDFVILYPSKVSLEQLIPKIADFLRERLHLTLHPDKTFIQTYASGVDFLGWVHFADHRTLRNSTKWRMFRKLEKLHSKATVVSYLGLLSHGNTRKIAKLVYRYCRE